MTDSGTKFVMLFINGLKKEEYIAVDIRTLYTQFDNDKEVCQKAEVFDISFGQGQWRLYCVIQASGSVSITPFSLSVVPSSKNGVMKKIDLKLPFYRYNDVVSSLMATKNFLVAGCPKCDTYGTVRVIDPETMEEKFTIKGNKNQYNVGNALSYNANEDYSEQVWYTSTSQNGRIQYFNSMLAFEDRDEGWQFWNKLDNIFEYVLPGGSSDSTVFSTNSRNVFYKANSATSLNTFQSCPMNQKYVIEDDDWTERSCEQCGFMTLFSFGFNAGQCKVCDEIKEILEVSDNYVTYFYNDACVRVDPDRGDKDKDKDKDNGQTTDPNQGKTGEETKEEETEEKQEEGSMTIFILVAVIAILIILVGFLFYKFYWLPKKAEEQMH